MKDVAKRVYEELCHGDPQIMLGIQDSVRKTGEKNDVNVFVQHDLFSLEPSDITAEFLSELFEAASEIETRNYLNGTFIPKGTVISEVHSELRFMTYRLRKAKEWKRKIRERCQTTNPLAVIMINESWVVSDPTWEGPVRNHPHRKDILQLSIMAKVFRKMRAWLVKNEAEGKALKFVFDGPDFTSSVFDKFFLTS